MKKHLFSGFTLCLTIIGSIYAQDDITLVKTIAAPSENNVAQFGTEVIKDGDYILASAPGDGIVYLFHKDEGGEDNWGIVEEFTVNNAAAIGFGKALAMQGSYIAIGAAEEDVDGITDKGAVYTYLRDFNNNWEQVSKLTDLQGQENDKFGYSLAMDGIYLAVGIPNQDLAGQGRVWIHKYNGSEWDYLTEKSFGNVGTYGVSVAIDNNILVVGDSYADAPSCDGGNSGMVFIYYKNEGGADNWGEIKSICMDGINEDRFGSSVSISGNSIVVGAYNYGSDNDEKGLIALFSQDNGGEDNWGLVTTHVNNNLVDLDAFGADVAIDDDFVIAGAPRVEGNFDVNAGSAYIHLKDHNGMQNSWGMFKNFSGTNTGDHFGESVDVGNEYYVIGAPYEDINATNDGAVKIFRNCYVPVVNGDPFDDEVCEGQSAVFNISVVGSFLSYHWYKDGEPLEDMEGEVSGSNTTSLLLSNVIMDDAGEYRCYVSSDCSDAIASAPAQLTVYPAPVINTALADQSSCVGGTVTFQTSFDGEDLSYQWYKDGVILQNETNTSLTIANIEQSDAGTYTCRVSNNCTEVDDSAILSLDGGILITEALADALVCVGGSVTFEAKASGEGLSYQWYKDDVELVGETNSILQLGNVEVTDQGTYACKIESACGSTTDDANLDIVTSIPINQSVQDLVYCEGEEVILEVDTNIQDLTYQWEQNGQSISGATSQTLVINSLGSDGGGLYSVTVSGACGNNVSVEVANISLQEQPTFTQISDDVNIKPGFDVNLSVEVSGQVDDYKWFKDGIELTDGDGIIGTTTPNLKISSIRSDQAGEYQCFVSGACSTSILSDKILVKVSEDAPDGPITSVAFEGSKVKLYPNPNSGQFTIDLSGNESVKATLYNTQGKVIERYRWRLDGDSYEFDISNQPKGVYYMKIKQHKSVEIIKFVME